ncbi:hypothetical protein LARV_00517 [Longilinea arvoryzae]|uniref:Uncharacterized protein n=1 Tax=Longilinea arvoryzae TaxID=360412 RepID=A0A0S7BBY8_9CHLR|nr:hypothetical protein [Longilinea arvoryzae]GAP12781.1 hypothetical protein LARV_00517 [Longilinea arvoryzae]
MIQRMLVFFVLAGMLVSCASVTPPTPPAATPGATRIPTIAPTASLTPAPTSDRTLERLAQTGGSINGITVMGDLAYVGLGPRVAVIDLRQPESPRLVSQSEPLPGLVSQLIQVSGGRAARLLVNAGKYLVLMDGSDPEAILPIRRLDLGGAITAMVWDERANILYAGGSIYQRPFSLGYTGFVSAVGLGPDDDLKVMSTVALPARVLSLALGQASLFAGAEGEESGLYHVRVSTPGSLSAPRRVIASTPEDPLQPTSMQVIGDRLYLGYRSIDAYDITNPDQPARAWRVYASIVVKSFQVAGEQVIAFGWTITNEFMLNTITPSEPIQGAPIGVISSVTAMHGTGFLVAYNDLEIHDAVDPQTPRLVGSFKAPVTHAIDAAAGDSAVFVVDNGTGASNSGAILRGFRLPDLEPLGQAPIEFPVGSGWYAYDGMALEGDRVYIAKADGVWAYAISGSEPTLLGKVALEDERFEAIAATRLDGKRLLLTAQSTEDHFITLKVYDLTDLQNPNRPGDPLTLDQGSGVQMVWNGAAIDLLLDRSYFSPESDRLYAITYENRALERKQSLEIPGYIEGMAAGEGFLLLTGIDESLSEAFVLVVESGPLKIASRTTLPEVGLGVAAVGDQARVVAGGGEAGAAQLLTLDVHDLADPRQVDALDIASSQNNAVPILATPSYVILANGSGGVEVLAFGR